MTLATLRTRALHMKVLSKNGYCATQYRAFRNSMQQQHITQEKVQENFKLKDFNEIPNWAPNKIQALAYALARARTGHLLVKELHEKNGPIFRSHLGPYNAVFIRDIEAIEEFVRKEEKVPVRLSPASWLAQWSDLGQTRGLLLSANEDWLRMRRAVNKVLLNTHKVASTADRINPVAKDLLDFLEKNTDADDVITLDDFIYKWSLETIGNVMLEKRFGLLSEAPNEDGKKMIKAVQDFFNSSNFTSIMEPKMAKILLRKYWLKERKALETMFDFCKKSIRERVDQIEKNPELEAGMLEYLLEHVGQGDSQMTQKEFYGSMIELMSAGVDTTSNSALFTLAELSKQPEIQEEIYKEIVSASNSPNDFPSTQTFQHTPLLRGTAKESLRMFPVAGTLARILGTDTVLMDYHIPKGITVMVSLYSVGRNPELFKDPDTFRPQRWLRGSEERKDINPFSFLPFGFGTRSCVGRRVAELEMHILLYQLLRKYRVVNTSDAPVTATFRLVLAPEHPLKVKLVKR